MPGGVAVEDFFLAWPNLSSAELEERRNSELAEQSAAASAFLGEEDAPDEEDEDLDDLPMDPSGPMARKKKATSKKKVVKKRSSDDKGDKKSKEAKPGMKKVVKKKKRPPE